MRNVILFASVMGLALFDINSATAALPKSRPYIVGHAATKAVTAQWSAAALCKAYNFPTNLPGGGIIGILEFGGGWRQSDLDSFSQLNGLPKIQVTNVSVDGTQNKPGVDTGADMEVALDIELAAAAYYYATGKMPTIIVFFSNGDFINTFRAAVAAKCSVLSISWGADEHAWQSQAPGYAQQVEAAAQSATASGLTIFAASGDNSSSDGDTGTNVDMPAACPHIVGCGGTTKSSAVESVWGDGKSTDWGTGGGFSKIFPAQSFQLGSPVAPKGLGRMVPDVAADADPNTGIVIVAGGSRVQIGGTSAVAPLYSGFFAAIGTKLGFVTPTLWKNPKAFVDITQGSNGAYSAGAGPDPCTGLGSPNGGAIAALFVTSAPPPPPPNIVAIGYNTTTKTLSLNGDGAANSFTITLKGSTLSIVGGGQTRVTLSTNSGTATSASSSATIAGFSGSLTITGNLSDGDDSISLIGLPITTITFGLGNGNDAAALSICTVGVSAIDGGAGVDVFTSLGTKISKNSNQNIP